MKFEWDENKNQLNLLKHKIDFQTASGIFNDLNRIEWIDERSEYGEQRFITIGKLLNAIIIVVYTVRVQVIRIISARPAKRQERNLYNEQLK
jgi:uncharacterized protein